MPFFPPQAPPMPVWFEVAGTTEPSATVVAGDEPTMPPFAGRPSDDQPPLPAPAGSRRP